MKNWLVPYQWQCKECNIRSELRLQAFSGNSAEEASKALVDSIVEKGTLEFYCPKCNRMRYHELTASTIKSHPLA